MSYRPRRRLAGLGFTLNDLIAATGMEDCSPRDTGCVARNQERDNAAVDLWMSSYMTHPETANLPTPKITVNLDTSQAAYDRYWNNQPLTTESISVGSGPAVTVANLERIGTPLTPGGGAVAPQLYFTTSRGGTVLYPGDTWSVKITGAAPNSPVVVVGGKGGAKDSATMGTTDAAGSFFTSGTIAASQAGTWAESWGVGGQQVGAFGFTVNAGVPITPAGQVIINSSGAQAVSPGGPAPPSSGFSLSSLPWYVWAIGAGVGLYALKGGR